ncbi:hypothetical protein KSS87_008443 [Heliosperma pusillum]|nr:hypothetical protein KSS87_008443 [Heliosperma pusillum]
MESIDMFLITATQACVTPLAIFIQIQGCLICLLLAFGWACAAYVRNREIKEMKNEMKCGNSLAFLYHDINELEHSKQVNLPRVSVVMPLKGFGEHNLHNWRSQITSLYGGPVEFLFVLESTEDPAYHAVSMLLKEFQEPSAFNILKTNHSSFFWLDVGLCYYDSLFLRPTHFRHYTRGYSVLVWNPYPTLTDSTLQEVVERKACPMLLRLHFMDHTRVDTTQHGYGYGFHT